MIEQNLVDLSILANIDMRYFAHYKNECIRIHDYGPEIPRTCLSNLERKDKFSKYFDNNFKELSKNDWELHKKLIEEGNNPNEIAKIIRNDEIEKLQEISSQNGFNFNQIIETSIYERHSLVNDDKVTLIDYAAFFSAVKCFKYLLMEGANIENTGKYAVACGNNEIIHLCEQKHSSFED